MMTFFVHISERPYLIADEDVEDVEARILGAVHAGGAFVDIRDVSGRLARVLITSASTVRIERVPRPVESEEDDGEFPDFAFLDFDEWN